MLEGGPLLHDYEAAQFHLHWGRTNASGSEHLVDGQSYPAEVVVVILKDGLGDKK